MSQNDSAVARAIVSHEIGLLRNGGGGENGSPTLTVPALVSKYGLDWGVYATQPVADQIVRNELGDAVARGDLRRAGKQGRNTIYEVV